VPICTTTPSWMCFRGLLIIAVKNRRISMKTISLKLVIQLIGLIGPILLGSLTAWSFQATSESYACSNGVNFKITGNIGEAVRADNVPIILKINGSSYNLHSSTGADNYRLQGASPYLIQFARKITIFKYGKVYANECHR